jgi:transposase-like protein DUF772
MGKRRRDRQPPMWVTTTDLPTAASHPADCEASLILDDQRLWRATVAGCRAWRAADSLALRDFLGVGLHEAPPDYSTISRTRRLIALKTHRAVFTWGLQCVNTARPGEGQNDRHRRNDA